MKRIEKQKIKRIVLKIMVLILAAAMMLGIVLQAAVYAYADDAETTVVIDSFKTGSLWTAIDKEKGKLDQNNVKSLVVSGGTMNADDVSSILMLSNIEYIDFSKTEIEKGKLSDAALSGRNRLSYISLPSNTKTIGNSAFNNCKQLKTVVMPETVTAIGSNAFESCESLEAIDLSPNITTIGDAAFRNCLSLKAITIPEGVSGIGANTFSKCQKLEKLNIPAGVSYIRSGAFDECSSLTDIYFNSLMAPVVDSGAMPQNNDVTVHAPTSALEYNIDGSRVTIEYDNPVGSEYTATTTAVTTTAAATDQTTAKKTDTTAERTTKKPNDTTDKAGDNNDTVRTEKEDSSDGTQAPEESTAAEDTPEATAAPTETTAAQTAAAAAQTGTISFTWWQLGLIILVCVVAAVAVSQIINRIFKKMDNK